MSSLPPIFSISTATGNLYGLTKKYNQCLYSYGTVLARHLIQSFLPRETSREIAHQIGLELCKKILKDEYEFVLSTHIDKGHIHNHIIFNNVNMVTGKCYQSNKKSYHQIRYQSDKLCKENNLSVIDEFYESYKRKYKTNGKSWYENEQSKKGTSWKSRLQFDIDRLIKQSKDWEEFLKKMSELGYEYWATKHNLNTMADSVILIREHGIKSIKQLDEYIQKSAVERQDLQDEIKKIDKGIQLLSDTMEQIHTASLL